MTHRHSSRPTRTGATAVAITSRPRGRRVLGIVAAMTLALVPTAAAQTTPTTVAISGGSQAASQRLPAGQAQFGIRVPLKPNAENRLALVATDRDGRTASVEGLSVAQISLTEIVRATVTTQPLTTQEIRQLVADGTIDVEDPSNYNVSRFVVALVVGGRQVQVPVPVVRHVQQPVAVGEGVSVGCASPGQGLTSTANRILIPCGGGGGGGGGRAPNIEIVPFEVAPPAPGMPSIPGVILIEGRIKTLKEFFRVNLLLMNLSPLFTLTDLTARVELPEGALSAVAPAGGTLSVPDLEPATENTSEFIVRGDRKGTHTVTVHFGGKVTGAFLPEPLPFSGQASTDLEVKGPPKLDVKVSHPDYVVANEPYDLEVTIRNTDSTLDALYTSLLIDVGGGAELIDPLTGDVMEGPQTRAVGDILRGETTVQTYRVMPLLTGPITSCVGAATENITLNVEFIGRSRIGCAIGTLPSERLNPDGRPTVTVVPAHNTTDVSIDPAITAIFSHRMILPTITTGYPGASFNVIDPDGNVVPGSLDFAELFEATAAIFRSDDVLQFGTTYSIVVNPSIFNESGVALASGVVARFTTEPSPVSPDGLAPEVAIAVEAPFSAGSISQGQTVPLLVGATDNVGVTRLDLLLDGELIDTRASTSAVRFLVETRALLPGSTHVLSARAFDASGNMGTATLSMQIVGDIAPPVVTIVADARVPRGQLLPVLVEAADDGRVDRVELFLAGSPQPVGVGLVEPYRFVVSTTALAAGSYQLRAVATDGAGNVGESTTSFEVTADVTPPQIALVAPAGNRFRHGALIAFATEATDNIGVGSIEYRLDVETAPRGLGSGGFTLDTAGLAPGLHVVTITATDTSGNVATLAVPFELFVPPPAALPPSPANVALIAPGTPMNGIVPVVGAAGAVGPGVVVTLTNLSTQAGAIAGASGSGAFTAQIEAAGGDTLRIVVTDDSGLSSTPVTVVVPAPPSLSSVSVSPLSFTLNRTHPSQLLTVTGHFSDGSQQVLASGLTFSSSAPLVASATAGGLVIPGQNGTATIQVGVTASGVTPVAVSVAVDFSTVIGVEPTPTSLTLSGLGHQDRITVQARFSDDTLGPFPGVVQFATTNPSIATVDNTGRVTATGFGSATINLSSAGLPPVVVPVTVESPEPTGITVSPSSLTLSSLGETVPLQVIVQYDDGTTSPAGAPGFLSSNDSVVTVSPNGLVSAVGDGTATIEVTALAFSVTVAVTVTLDYTATLPTSLLLRAGETAGVPVTLDTPAPAGGVVVTLASSATTTATVNPSVTVAGGETTATATVAALRGGGAQLTASIGGVVKATSTVTVIGGVLTGTVVAPVPEGEFVPVGGAQVTVSHGGPPAATVTAADGTFVVEGLVGASVSVRATDSGRLDVRTVDLSAPGGFADVTLTLAPVGSLSGTVRRADGVTPAGADVMVRLFEAAAPSVAIATTFTGADGRYLFPLVAPGGYVIIASAQNVDIGRAEAAVASGEEVVADVVTLARATVEITVNAAAGAPVSGAVVSFEATSALGTAPQRTATTDGEGVARFADVLAGTFTATANDPATGQGGSTSGQVVADGATVSATITLSAFGNITGTVVRADGTTPVPGAMVTARCGPTCAYTREADANGAYSFLFLPLGTYTMFATDPGTRGQGVHPSVVAFAVSGETIERDVTLRPQGALLATVVDAGGQPVDGATVTVEVTSAPLTDVLSGTTGIVDGQAGRVLLDRLLAGSFTVTATAAGLSGAGTPGTIVADEVSTVTIALEPRGSITVAVFDQDGETPAAGSVRITRTTGAQVNGTLANGTFTATDLPMGSYFVDAFDGAGRRRATTSGIVLAVNGDHPTVALAFVAQGTVRGRVIHPNVGGDVGHLTVSVQALDPIFGGFRFGQTDAAGNYEVTGVTAGAVRVTSSKPAEQLLGESTGVLTYVPPAPAVISIDVLLQDNAVTLPTTLADGNNSGHAITQAAGLGESNVRTFRYGGLGLTLTPQGGAPQTFTGATLGTRENAGREIAVRQDGVGGLDVTRKVFVPATGYFARYLELLSNPTGEDVTVDVAVESRLYGGVLQFCSFQCERTHFLSTTSSGDDVIDVASETPDRWVSFGATGANPYVNPNEVASVSFVFDGEGGSVRVGSAVYEALNPNVSPFLRPRFAYAWQSVTVPAGSTVALMHFVSLQGGVPAATASADRLVQLPPEALEGLSASEIAAIANFAVPATGTSLVAPLPPITGTVTGQVLEGDAQTGVGNAWVRFRSTVPVHPRQLEVPADASGNFTITGVPGTPVPVADFTLDARHPINQIRVSPPVTGGFAPGLTTTAQAVIFSDGGVLTGIVRRHTGAPVVGANVAVDNFGQALTDANGRYHIGGVVAGDRLLRGTVSHPQGTALQIVEQLVTLSAGEVRDDALLVEPTGAVQGVLLDAAGVPQPSRQVRLRDGTASYQRFATTNASGQFTFTDARLGSFTVASTDPSNNLEVSEPVVVAVDQTSLVELRYVGNVAMTVLVTRANGTPIGGMSVQVTGTGFSRPVVTTNASGIATVTDVPAGRAATVAAFHPLQPAILQTTQAVTTAPGQELTLALPAFGSISGTVRRPNGALVGPGVRVEVFQGTGAPSFYYQTFTDANSRYATDTATQPVPANVNVNVRVQRPEALSDGFNRPTLTFADHRITADGQALALDVRTPAVASVRFTVTEGGLPVSGAGVFPVFSNGSEPASTTSVTNATGQVTLAEIVEGSYAYRVRRTNQRSSDLLDVAAVVVGPASDGGIVDVAVDVRRFTITVRGTLVQADGVTPLPSPQGVELLRAVDRRQLATVCVGGSGCGQAGLAPGEYHFTQFDATADFWNNPSSGTATGAGVIVRVRSPFYPFESSVIEQLIVPTADGEYVVPPIAVPVHRATIEGQLLAADGATPAGIGVVNLDFVDNTTTRISGAGRNVNEDGTFTFADVFLPVEGARVKLWNVVGLTSGQVSAVTGPVSSIGAVLPVTLTLPPSTFVTARGRVVAGDGVTPLEGMHVDLRYGTNLVTSVSTDGDGRFERRVLAGPDGQIVARVRPFVQADIDVERTAATQGELVDFGDIAVPISVLSGRVRYGSAAPVVFPNVFARHDAGATAFPQTTRSDGTYVFVGIPQGDYTVTASDNDGLEASIEVTLAASDSVVTGADIQLPELATLHIQVRGRDGQPAEYANVVVRSGPTFERQLGWFAEAEEGGAFTVRVPLGTVTVEAEALTCLDAYWWDTCTGLNGAVGIEIADATIDHHVTIDLSDFGGIGFNHVTLQGGAPLPGPLEVSWLGEPHPSFLTPQRTDAAVFEDGEWRIGGVPPGTIRVALRSGNYVTYSDEPGPDPGSGWSSGPWELFAAQRVRSAIFDDNFDRLADRTVLVIIESELGERRFVTTTDGAGEIVVEGLWPHDMSRVRFLVIDDGTGYEVEVWPDGSPEMYVEVFNINF